jgi:hypothetical protein
MQMLQPDGGGVNGRGMNARQWAAAHTTCYITQVLERSTMCDQSGPVSFLLCAVCCVLCAEEAVY